MIDLLVRNARLQEPDATGPVDLHVDGGRFVAVTAAGDPDAGSLEAWASVDAAGSLVSAPYVEPQVQLDAVLNAGQPCWNQRAAPCGRASPAGVNGNPCSRVRT